MHTDKSELDEFIRDHTKSIQKAFADSQVRSSRRYVDYGFDAEAVSEKLETILEKARFLCVTITRMRLFV